SCAWSPWACPLTRSLTVSHHSPLAPLALPGLTRSLTRFQGCWLRSEARSQAVTGHSVESAHVSLTAGFVIILNVVSVCPHTGNVIIHLVIKYDANLWLRPPLRV